LWAKIEGAWLREVVALHKREAEAPVGSWYRQSIVRERLRQANAGRYGVTLTKGR